MTSDLVDLRVPSKRSLLKPKAAGPSWLVFQLLERCNLRCNMCYEWGDAGAYKALSELAELDVDTVLRTIRECLPARPYVEFFGGEPLLYKGIWEIVAFLRSEGCELAFPTNGTLLAQHAEKLVSASPTRVWISLDGPKAVNDAQRGQGVYDKAMRGIDAIDELKRQSGLRYPELGITFVVTPNNYRSVEEFFLELDLSRLGAVSIELQSYITTEQHRHYSRVAHQQFGVTSTPSAAAYVRSPLFFSGIDVADLVGQMQRVRLRCEQHGVRFFSQPRTLELENFRAYLRADFRAMTDHHERCAVPWVYAEISARGDVTTCHSFYDVSIGNIHEHSLLDIWHGQRAQDVRSHLRDQLFDICTACCRYYSASAHAIGERP